MKTRIITAHEEEYSNKSNTLGVFLNIDEQGQRIDSLVYLYREKRKMYIFFNTIMDMNEYILYGDGKMQRAYLPESDFDYYYDAISIDGKFTNHLTWTTKNTP